MQATNFEEWRAALENEISDAARELRAVSNRAKSLHPDCEQDLWDLATEDRDEEVLHYLDHHQVHRRDEAREALQRLAEGSYGICQGCGRDIALDRLRALPAARCCVDCQERVELGLPLHSDLLETA